MNMILNYLLLNSLKNFLYLFVYNGQKNKNRWNQQ